MNLTKVAEVHGLLTKLAYPVIHHYIEAGVPKWHYIDRFFLNWDGTSPRAIKTAKKLGLVKTRDRHIHWGRPAIRISLTELGAKITRTL